MRQAELKCKLDNRINEETEDRKDRSKQIAGKRKLQYAPVCHSNTSRWERAMHFGSRMSKAYRKEKGGCAVPQRPQGDIRFPAAPEPEPACSVWGKQRKPNARVSQWFASSIRAASSRTSKVVHQSNLQRRRWAWWLQYQPSCINVLRCVR